ncbi:hypothetical protein E5676_scaffold205G002450 [Cucumis melo var. makuwa]|uniref:Uncharacterized protein n=1 Tax=Cucumis melo var. makuwa TaxID=1194695 RepID=A0A5A7UL65_CUCMM|nr:hypothetical protein E6C27_scaffold43052G002000 [Cucumis melo var. makuwa]TYK24442.1 hypothetical protein E5676_scaffold205G002450 [Cucumis melo var. makuwa]
MEILMGLMEERESKASPPLPSSPVIVVDRLSHIIRVDRHLAEPICLSLSRQPAPVLAPILEHLGPIDFGALDFFRPRCLESAFFLLLGLVEQISKITTYLGLRSPTRPPVWHGYRYDSSDSTGSSQPDCLSASSGFATDQYVLGAPSGQRRPDSVPTGAHVARVRERASYWVEAGIRVRASWRATRSDHGEP